MSLINSRFLGEKKHLTDTNCMMYEPFTHLNNHFYQGTAECKVQLKKRSEHIFFVRHKSSTFIVIFFYGNSIQHSSFTAFANSTADAKKNNAQRLVCSLILLDTTLLHHIRHLSFFSISLILLVQICAHTTSYNVAT